MIGGAARANSGAAGDEQWRGQPQAKSASQIGVTDAAPPMGRTIPTVPKRPFQYWNSTTSSDATPLMPGTFDPRS